MKFNLKSLGKKFSKLFLLFMKFPQKNFLVLKFL